jgi:hypothetical protein
MLDGRLGQAVKRRGSIHVGTFRSRCNGRPTMSVPPRGDESSVLTRHVHKHMHKHIRLEPVELCHW